MAVLLTPLATTGQRALSQGCWVEEGSFWRVPQHGCREAGANKPLVRDMDLGVPSGRDSRRLEVVADGLPLFGGMQLAIDTTLVSAVVEHTFIQNRIHPLTLSSKHDFIQ